MELIKPSKLSRGDKVAAITLSWGGAGEIPHRYNAGKKQLEEQFGVEVVETRHALKSAEWIYKNPRARADDLMEAFSDSRVKAIFSTIGGDDSIRLLPFVDLSVIRNNPKIFMGYSDTTVSHFMCYAASVTSFYGPSILTGLAENGGMHPYLISTLTKTLFTSSAIGELVPNTDGWTVERLEWKNPSNQSIKRKLQPPIPWRWLNGSGKIQGHLLGGCAEVLEFLKETSLWPQKSVWKGAIFFLETSEEAPSPSMLRRWLRNYAISGVMEQVSAFVVGRPGGNIPPEKFSDYDDAILETLVGEFGYTQLPIVTCMDFGHTDPMFVLPFGVKAELDCEEKKFSILENAVV